MSLLAAAATQQSGRLLITLTTIEILALVIVLATYLIMISRLLRSIAATLAKVTFGVRAVDQQCANIAPAVSQVNAGLRDIVGALPGIASKAETLASRR
ncbi:MAG: hypothetical protein ACR2FO_01660 [Actinomycetota bacterium]